MHLRGGYITTLANTSQFPTFQSPDSMIHIHVESWPGTESWYIYSQRNISCSTRQPSFMNGCTYFSALQIDTMTRQVRYYLTVTKANGVDQSFSTMADGYSFTFQSPMRLWHQKSAEEQVEEETSDNKEEDQLPCQVQTRAIASEADTQPSLAPILEGPTPGIENNIPCSSIPSTPPKTPPPTLLLQGSMKRSFSEHISPNSRPASPQKKRECLQITSAIRNALELAEGDGTQKRGLLNFFSRGTRENFQNYWHREDERQKEAASEEAFHAKSLEIEKKDHERGLARLQQQKH